MTTLSPKYLELLEKVKRKKEFLEKHKKILEDMLKTCTHEETFVEEHYFSGSYNDRAHTDYYTRCSLCGKIIETRTKEHSWYG